MTYYSRAELEQRCHDLMVDGQHVTSKIEGLLQRPEPMEGSRFDRELERLRQEESEIHRKLEQTLQALQALEKLL